MSPLLPTHAPQLLACPSAASSRSAVGVGVELLLLLLLLLLQATSLKFNKYEHRSQCGVHSSILFPPILTRILISYVVRGVQRGLAVRGYLG